MKAEDLRELIREVLREQEEQVRFKPQSLGGNAFGKSGKEDRLEANPELSNMERGIIQQIDKFLLDLAEMPGVELQTKRATLERIFNMLKKQVAPDGKDPEQK